jgi:hypothetical protein
LAKLSKEKILGTKFEIYVELLLNDNFSYRKVRRNINYIHQSVGYRQVDVEYHNFSPLNSLVIMELKYCSNGKLGLNLKSGKKIRNKPTGKNGQKIKCIDNVIAETEERRKFVGASKVILVTNNYFQDSLRYETERWKYSKVKLYDLSDLVQLERDRGLFSTILPRGDDFFERRVHEGIKSINLRKYNLTAIKEYM